MEIFTKSQPHREAGIPLALADGCVKLDTIKCYIKELPDQDFDDFYQQYIFRVQDQNIIAEVGSVRTSDILSLDSLIAKLHKELFG